MESQCFLSFSNPLGWTRITAVILPENSPESILKLGTELGTNWEQNRQDTMENRTWLVSDASDGPSVDWHIHEFQLAKVRWRALNISRVTEAKWVDAPDLSHVEAVGFTDLMPGGLSDASSRLDWIEVYGRAVSRSQK